MESQVVCATCGVLFAPRTSGGKPQVRCSARCRRKIANANFIKKNAPVKVTNCADCGAEISHLDIGRPRRFCGDECKQRAGNRAQRRRRLPIRDPNPDSRSCSHCGCSFVPRRRDQVYCQRACQVNASQRRRYYEEPLRQGAAFDRQCVECAETFVAQKANARWCSPSCRRRFTGREESRRRGPARPDADHYTDREIFERDGWICQICHQPVEPAVSRRASDGATIDHVIPLSFGGADKRNNVVTAHNRCNREKRNQVPVYQLIDALLVQYPGLLEAKLKERDGTVFQGSTDR